MSTHKYTDLNDMFVKSVAAYGPNKAIGEKVNGVWTYMSYAEFGRRVDAVRGGLAAAGIGRDDVVAMIARNSKEWAILAYASYGLGARFCPMYENQLEKDWKYIVNDSGAKLLVAYTNEIYDTVKGWAGQVGQLEGVLGVQLDAGDANSLAALEAKGAENPVDTVPVDSSTVCGFIYTSGTTGQPKGVLLTHGNITSNINAVHEVFPMRQDDSSVSFLPWAHSFGQTVELHCLLSMGACLSLAESVEKLVDNFGEVKPTLMFAVPRIFNKIYDGLNKKMEEAGGAKKKLFDKAMANAGKRNQLEEQGRSSLTVNLKHAVFDKLVFSKVRERFGGRLKYAFSGGAALSPEVAQFIDNVGILVFEGYGLTETSPIASANWPGNRRIGSIGKAIPGVTVKIDTGVLDDADSTDGEIVVYGPNVMAGYHNLPEETAAVTTADGGFRTGDRGRKDADGFIYITGRIKEQYKLENGKYVVPAPLEEKLQLSPMILQAYVHGMNKPFNVGLIIPDNEAALKWASENGAGADYEAVLKNDGFRKAIEEQIARYSGDFKGYERLKQFAFVAEEFTTDNGFLTPKMSVKRRVVEEVYGDLIEQLYAE